MQMTTNMLHSFENKINAVDVLIFDLDGTLIDTNYANYLSYKKAVHEVLKFNFDFNYNRHMRFTRNTLKSMIHNLSDSQYSKIIQLKKHIYSTYISKTKLNHSIVNVLKKYSDTKQCILATNSERERAIATLKHHGLASQFHHKYYSNGDTFRENSNKFEHILLDLKLSASSIIVFEDEQVEVNNAIYAGIPSSNIMKEKKC